MSPCDDRLPDDLQDVADRLRDHRTTASATELDSLKLRAMSRARARTSRPKGRSVRSRIATAFVAVCLMVGGTGGVIAATGGSSGSNDAAKAQYKPGYGPCKNGGVDGSGATHTGPPGQPGQNCSNK